MASLEEAAAPPSSQKKRPRAVFIMRHGEREDYSWKEQGRNWQQAHSRPWDTPLTANGHLQGAAGGRAVATHVARLGVQPVKHVLVSPLLRCAQTGSAAAKALGVRRLTRSVALAETMNEDWYRSWAVPGADSTWGGPPHSRKGVAVARESLHPAALQGASVCHATAEALTAMLRERGDADMIVEESGSRYVAASPALSFNWDACESHAHQAARMKAICEGFFAGKEGAVHAEEEEEEEEEGSVLLVSHGGPTSFVYCALTGSSTVPPTGYCGLYGYTWVSADDEQQQQQQQDQDQDQDRPPSEERKSFWKALVVSDHDHLREVDAPISGRNDMQEQDAAAYGM